MAVVRDMVTVMRSLLVEGYKSIFRGDQKFAKHARETLIVVLILAAGFGGFKLYRYYISSREATAQKVFYECMMELENAKRGIGSWYDVEVAFEMGHRQNSRSQLAPFFLVFKSEALQAQGKKQEAINLLNDTLGQLKKDSNMYWIYKVKLALSKMDMPDETIQKEGINELQEISCLKGENKKENSGTVPALFYIGSYYWEKNNFDKAKEAWNKLIGLQKDGSKSPYVNLVKEKLQQIS